MRKSSNLFTPVLLVVFWAACLPSISWGQAAGGGGGIGGDLSGVAGVLVDPEGVLKLRTYEDPNGALMRSRIHAARAALPQDIRQRSPLRKVSLNRLEKALADAIDNNRQPDEAMLYLAGLNRLEYVFYYPTHPF